MQDSLGNVPERQALAPAGTPVIRDPAHWAAVRDGMIAVVHGPAGTANLDDSDDPYDQAVAVVLRDGKASTSYIQRRLGIGYNRAASLIERMEKEGLIGPANHAGKREILVPTEDEITGR